ncbi:cytochrome c biogenesis protein CcdA [Patescibacteria group bacterium]|nr:cytochrome c biogenesis protein CcdA [Patescibacteria group bacterium]MBU1673886.1 cytochrome c biogenesis protein CcdA [Patescibacteria group bacterium]MBU1963441.1 cytochrome c biogenesis protein CcdA [Patescibacteria group bacterium]
MDYSLVIPAFIAGLLTFLAPCTLPLVPAYIGFIAGPKKKIISNAIAFIIGFSVVFILFGTLAGLLGQALTPYRIWLSRIGGIFVIIFGLFMIGMLKVPFLAKNKRLKMPKALKVGSPVSSFLVGAAFAFGWTPCVGPILASILLLATSSATAWQGAFLLAVFSLGLAVPFLLVAIAFGSAVIYIKKLDKVMKYISVIGGIFLIILGLLLLTNNFNLLISYGFQALDSFGYEGLLEHL